MNIAIVTNWFPSGAGYVSKAYRQALENQGADVFVYARGGKKMKGDSLWDDSQVYWAHNRNGDLDTNHLLKWVKKTGIDVVFFNEQRYWSPLIALKKAGVCIGAYVDYYTQKSIKAFAVYDFLLCNTKRHHSVFDWHSNAYYIPWGTDINKFSPAKKVSEDLKFIISAGWQLDKGTDRRGSRIALEAFLKTTGQAKLYFYSQVELDKAPEDLVEMIKSDSRVEFISGTKEPFPFNEGHVYLYPSRLDGIGLTVPEALSSGLAVITTNNAPMNEFVIDGKNGKLVEVMHYLGRHDGYYWAESLCNLTDLTLKIQEYIDQSSLAMEHGYQARCHALENLDWIRNSQSLGEIFEACRNKRRKGISVQSEALCNSLDKESKPSFTTHCRRAINVLKSNIKEIY